MTQNTLIQNHISTAHSTHSGTSDSLLSEYQSIMELLDPLTTPNNIPATPENNAAAMLELFTTLFNTSQSNETTPTDASMDSGIEAWLSASAATSLSSPPLLAQTDSIESLFPSPESLASDPETWMSAMLLPPVNMSRDTSLDQSHLIANSPRLSVSSGSSSSSSPVVSNPSLSASSSTSKSTAGRKRKAEREKSRDELLAEIEDRRRRNTESARRSRQRKLQEMSTLQEELAQVKAERDALRAELEALKRQRIA